MKKSLVGTALALFAVAPAMAWADCDFHDKASMASKSTDKAELTQQQATNKASSPVVAKTSGTKVKQASDKKATPSKTDASTVVAKNN
jgi:hypothetical protein